MLRGNVEGGVSVGLEDVVEDATTTLSVQVVAFVVRLPYDGALCKEQSANAQSHEPIYV